MGSDVHLIGVGATASDLQVARAHIEELEQRWSRFRPESEISRMNAASGDRVIVSEDTFELVARAIEGRRATGGLFDPMLLGALTAAGYDRSFERLAPQEAPLPPPGVVAGASEVELDELVRSIRLPQGAAFDPGGIGKGFGADLVCERMLEAGARGACVNIGGDLRAAGEPPSGDGWIVAVDDPFTENPMEFITLEDGAVCTTSRLRRTWSRGGAQMHHLIDPSTGTSARTGVSAVTVLASEGWWAEVATKAAFMAGVSRAGALLEELDVSGRVFDDDGVRVAAVGWEAYAA